MAGDGFDPVASPLRVFGAMLRHYRTTASLSQADLAARVHFSDDLVSKIEQALRAPSKEFAAACDAVSELGTGGALARLRGLLREYQTHQVYPAWFHRWPEAEAEARALRWYEPLLIPGLLQTEDYARAVLWGQPDATEEAVAEQVAARMERQEVLAKDSPPHLWCVVDEGVLHRRIGGHKVMHDQLLHLAQMSGRPMVSVQVVPFESGAHAGLLAHFAIAVLDGARDTLYLETATVGQVCEVPAIVEQATVIFDTLRSEALPRGASKDLIMKVAEDKWTD